MGEGRVGGLKTGQFRIELGGHNEGGELRGEKIGRAEGQHYQQDNRYQAEKYISDDQPVAQPPKQFHLEPAEGEKTQQNEDEKTENADPPTQSLSPGNLQQPEQLSQSDQQQVEAQEITSGAC